MSSVIQPDPTAIGDVSTPPFAVLPDPLEPLHHPRPAAARAQRLQRHGALSGFRRRASCEAQAAILPGLPEPERPDAEALARAREFAMPPLDRTRFALDEAVETTLDALFDAVRAVPKPETAANALGPGRPRRRHRPRRDGVERARPCHPGRSARRACLCRRRAPGAFRPAGLPPRCEPAGRGRRWPLPGLRRAAGRLAHRRMADRARLALLRLRAVRHAVELCPHPLHLLRLDQGHRLSGDRRRVRAPSRPRPATSAAPM